jgi:hypothetical protein
LAALGWQRSDLDPHYPAHVAYAGNDHLVLAVRERSLLAALDYDFPMLGAALMAQRAWTTVHLVWAESRTLFHAGDPFPPGGVIEDPPPALRPPRSADTYAHWGVWSSCACTHWPNPRSRPRWFRPPRLPN